VLFRETGKDKIMMQTMKLTNLSALGALTFAACGAEVPQTAALPEPPKSIFGETAEAILRSGPAVAMNAFNGFDASRI